MSSQIPQSNDHNRIQDALLRNRLKTAQLIRGDIPAHVVIDQRESKFLTAELGPPSVIWHALRVVDDGSSLSTLLPDVSGLYMFVLSPQLLFQVGHANWSPNWVLYVGRAGRIDGAGTIRKRFKTEYRKYFEGNLDGLWGPFPTSRQEKMSIALSLRPLEVWYAEILDLSKIEDLETRLIQFFNPPLNKQSGLIIRKESERDAFKEYGI